RDSAQTLVVAVAAPCVFEAGGGGDAPEPYSAGPAFPLIQAGIAAAQLTQQTALHSTEQLRVGFYDFSEDSTDAQEPLREFSALVGRMRQRFGLDDSPLSTSLITGLGTRNTCLQALKTLRSWGLDVDEAYCLAGAPSDPILSLIKPHVLVMVSPQPVHAP
ncbi:hypothetical protein CRUP_011849, partial [Coryphaenoides rupestris]